MRRLLIYFIPLACLMHVSCDSLELEPVNSTTTNTFYNSPANLETGLYGIYDALQLSGVFGELTLMEGMSDNCISGGTAGDIVIFASGKPVIANGEIKRLYRDPYVLIQRANLLLDNADDIVGIVESDRETIKIEARALRAMAYMKLVYLFGDVPLLETSKSRSEVFEVSRTDRNTIVAFILNEFESAASVLNNTPVSEGRLTKQAVLGLRARVMLYEARMGNQTWADALTAINLAVTEANNGGHKLIDTDNPTSDYQSLFTEANENNSEFIFSVVNNLTDKGLDFKENISWQAGFLKFYIHQNLADDYDYADGSVYNPSDKTYDGRDPRLSTNIMHEGLTFDGLTYDGTDNGGFVGLNSLSTDTNLFFNKFVTTDFSATWNEGQLDVPVLRYADLLLMQAEALNETGANGHASINLVRNRAGLPDLVGLSQSALRDKIIHERRVELALEGQRWYDLITLGIAESKINAIVEEGSNFERGFTIGRSELLPIPQDEIGLNPNLTQNPGY